MRPARGPALGKAPLPVTATVLSAILHVVLAVAFVLGARAWSQSQPKTYVVNLVPAVAAVGSPQGRTTPILPPRPEEIANPEPTRPTELPQRETARETAAPEMPARSREPLALPDRATALRDAARGGQGAAVDGEPIAAARARPRARAERDGGARDRATSHRATRRRAAGRGRDDAQRLRLSVRVVCQDRARQDHRAMGRPGYPRATAGGRLRYRP